MERVRARHFTKTWGFVQGAEAIPVLLGVPITGKEKSKFYVLEIYF